MVELFGNTLQRLFELCIEILTKKIEGILGDRARGYEKLAFFNQYTALF